MTRRSRAVSTESARTAADLLLARPGSRGAAAALPARTGTAQRWPRGGAARRRHRRRPTPNGNG